MEPGKLSLLVKCPQEIAALINLFKGVFNDSVVFLLDFFLRFILIQWEA
jgi:hypothetical protein